MHDSVSKNENSEAGNSRHIYIEKKKLTNQHSKCYLEADICVCFTTSPSRTLHFAQIARNPRVGDFI